MRYEGNPKHKEPWQRGRRGSLCPPEIDQAQAQTLLQESVAGNDDPQGPRYAAFAGRAYCAQCHAGDRWHGYPIGWVEVPEPVRCHWLREKKVRRRDIREHWD